MNKTHKHDPSNAGIHTSKLLFCDLRCEHASFPKSGDMDGSGSCRTFAAIYCAALQEHVTKNAPCSIRFGKRRPKTIW